MPGNRRAPHERIPTLEEYYQGRIPAEEIEAIRHECAAEGAPLHDALMDRAGWPQIPFDGKLLVSHQDALLMGGKVQAPGGYRDHVHVPAHGSLCEGCRTKVCIEMCSGQAIAPGEDGGVPRSTARSACTAAPACGTAPQARPRQPGSRQHPLPRRRRRAAFGGELRRHCTEGGS